MEWQVDWMEILGRFEISLDAEELLRAGRSGEEPSSACEEAARRALHAGMEHFEGKAFLETYFLEESISDRESLILRREERVERESLRIGPEAELLAEARIVVTALCTIGEGVEASLKQQKSGLVRYYLNVFGVKALESVRHAVQEEIASRARSRGWGVSPSLSPGSLRGWPVEGQRDIFRLTGGEKTGMRINEAALLTPATSMSFLVGMGPGFASTCVRSLCSRCPRYRSCAWRQEDLD